MKQVLVGIIILSFISIFAGMVVSPFLSLIGFTVFGISCGIGAFLLTLEQERESEQYGRELDERIRKRELYPHLTRDINPCTYGLDELGLDKSDYKLKTHSWLGRKVVVFSSIITVAIIITAVIFYILQTAI